MLTVENYNKGFLVDDELIAGVTEMENHAPSEPRIFSAYVSHYLTGETMAYAEFDALEPALEFLAKMDRNWKFEAVGCEKKTAASSQSCGSCKSC